MQNTDVDHWLDRYVDAWKTYEREQIASLFSEDVAYRYHPYDEPVSGRDAVVRSWLGEGSQEGASTRDEPGTYDASYRAGAVDGDVAVATGTTRYSPTAGAPTHRVFDNCFVIRFDSSGALELPRWGCSGWCR